jgi:hypothetical protein
MKSSPNYRAALDAGRALCLHIKHPWPGASERGCSADKNSTVGMVVTFPRAWECHR